MKRKIIKFIEKILHIFFSKDSMEDILKKINNDYDYISFDIFDTLIKRNVINEKDIFKVVEKRYNLKYSKGISDFYSQRVEAEKKARKNRTKNEINIDDIYRYINYSEKEKRLLKEIEYETEIDFCVPNKRIKKIYDSCLSKNKKIIITSDMYLPNDVIKKILDKAGYLGYNKLYLSCDVNATKRKGDLFDYIINELGTKKIIHIGDNAISDFCSAKIKKIDSILIKNRVNNLNYLKKDSIYNDLSYNIIYSTANNLVEDSDDIYQIMGYSILGPLLFGYCNYLQNYIREKNIDKTFFLARDGKIIMDAYKIFNDDNFSKNSYIYLSRKSTSLPLLSSAKNIKEFNYYADSILKRKKMKDIKSILNIESSEYDRFLNKNNISDEMVYEKLSNEKSDSLFDFFKNNLFKYSNEQREMLIEYLNKKGFKGRVCLADIGWKGTIQKNLNALNEFFNVDIFGCYYGIYNSDDDKNGFLYSGSEKKKYEIYNSIGIFENLFLNMEGSTIGYKIENGEVVPKLDQCEQTSSQQEDILKMQEYALKYVECLNLYKLILPINNNIYYKNYHDMVVTPSYKFIKRVKNMLFLDGKVYKMIDNKSLFFYIFHPRAFSRDIINSYYKIGFLKNMLKIPLPYSKILEILYRIKKKEV